MIDNASWIESTGGPFVMVPCSKVRLWRGVQSDDYAAACTVEAYVGMVERAWGQVLILNDEPLRTAITSTESGLAIVRWMYAPSAYDLLEAVKSFVADPEQAVERSSFTFLDEPYLIFDSSSTGGDAQSLTLVPPAHARGLATYVARPDHEIGFVLHCFI